MNLRKVICFIMLFVIPGTAFSCNEKKTGPEDFLNAGSQIVFDGTAFNLAWSSHPNENYYKQEYVTDGDNVEKYGKMILLEVLITEKSAEEIAETKVSELKQLQQSNPFVNYNVFSKDGEYMIDFLMSDKPVTPDIIERNVYRYRAATDERGIKYILLFGVSERAYGNGIDDFLSNLKAVKNDLTNAVAGFALPGITLSN